MEYSGGGIFRVAGALEGGGGEEGELCKADFVNIPGQSSVYHILTY